MNVEILSQFPSPPVPNLPSLTMAMAPVMPQHQQPMITQTPVSMAMPSPTPPIMAMTSAAPSQPPTNTNFIASFPPAQVSHASDPAFPWPLFVCSDYCSYSLTHILITVVDAGEQNRWRWFPGLPGGSKGRSKRPGLHWVPGGVRRKLPHHHSTSATKQVPCVSAMETLTVPKPVL